MEELLEPSLDLRGVSKSRYNDSLRPIKIKEEKGRKPESMSVILRLLSFPGKGTSFQRWLKFWISEVGS